MKTAICVADVAGVFETKESARLAEMDKKRHTPSIRAATIDHRIFTATIDNVGDND